MKLKIGVAAIIVCTVVLIGLMNIGLERISKIPRPSIESQEDIAIGSGDNFGI